ncbi:MAG: SDR family oxidoreductase [Candidatus Binatia bacterium]
MRVLVVGASGFVGSRLQEVFPGECVGTYHSHPVAGLLPLDVRDRDAVDRVVAEVAPDLIFHPAAQAHVDWCETHVEESFEINVHGARNVAEAARKVGARYIYFSSDYVFNGAAGPYTEDATPDPLNAYGRQKLAAECLVAQDLENYLIVRLCGVYGYQREGKNFVMALLERGRRAESMNVPCDQWGTPTYAASLAAAVKALALSAHRGIVHVVGPECMDRATFARLACAVFGLDPAFLRPCRTAELQQAAPRPLRGGLVAEKVRGLLGSPLLSPRQGLELMARQVVREGWGA